MVNAVPQEVPRPKPEGPQAPRFLAQKSWQHIYALFKGCTNPNLAMNKKEKYLKRKFYIIYGFTSWTYESG